MHRAMLDVLNRVKNLRVAVVGDAILDSFLRGEAEGVAADAPVPLVRVTGREDVPGGAANTAANVASLGAGAVFLSVVGADEAAATLGEVLTKCSVPTGELVRVEGRHTTVKQRVLAGHRMVLRLDSESASAVPWWAELEFGERLRRVWRDVDALILSDYGYGLFTDGLLDLIAGLQRDEPRVLVVDAKNLARFHRVRPTAVKPNYQEAVRLLGLPLQRAPGARMAQVAAHEVQLLQRSGARLACVTLDVEGAVTLERGRPAHHTPTQPKPEQNASGAGDTFVSMLTLALAAGAETVVAVELASLAARVAVEEEGTTCCTLDEVRLRLIYDSSKVMSVPRLAAQVERLRRQGKRVVLTSGCFDLLHRGQVAFLSWAKALGDVLVVAVQADESAARLRGPAARPVNGLEDRVKVLAGLGSVDYIVEFEEETCEALLRAVRPEVYAHGESCGEEGRAAVTGPWAESLVGEVQQFPYLAKFNTGQTVSGKVDEERA